MAYEKQPLSQAIVRERQAFTNKLKATLRRAQGARTEPSVETQLMESIIPYSPVKRESMACSRTMLLRWRRPRHV